MRSSLLDWPFKQTYVINAYSYSFSLFQKVHTQSVGF